MFEAISTVAQTVIASVAVATLMITIKNTAAIQEVHRQTNSLKDELVREVRTASFAAGKLEQKDADVH